MDVKKNVDGVDLQSPSVAHHEGDSNNNNNNKTSNNSIGSGNVDIINPPRSSGEVFRDKILATLDSITFQALGAFVLFVVIVDGAFYFFLLCGWHAMCHDPSRTKCEPRNWWYNFSIQVLNACFTYMSVVSMPWRCTNLIHLSDGACPRRSYESGKDLYGQTTNEIWFHIPRKRRIYIMTQLLFNCLFQFANQATRIIYSDFYTQDVFPGNIWTNVFFFLSMLTSITGGIHTALAEKALRKQYPEKFGPGPIEITKQYLCNKSNKRKNDDDDKIHNDNAQESLRQQQDKNRPSLSQHWTSSQRLLNYDRNAMRLYGM